MIPSIDEFYKTNKLNERFDEVEYQKQHPETLNFYQPYCKEKGISDKKRLYFHQSQYRRNLIISSIHKCGTCLQQDIFKFVANEINYRLYYLNYYNENQFDKDFSVPYISVSRHIPKNFEDKTKYFFDYINIIRHPLNRLISEYYSFGWTHREDFFHIIDPNLRKELEENFKELRKKIKKISVDDYIKFSIYERIEEYESAFKLGNIIPYELMISEPEKFFKLITKKLISMNITLEESFIQKINKNFIYEMSPVEDISDKITEGRLEPKEDSSNNLPVGFRRNSDNGEYLKKLSRGTINFAYEEFKDVMNSYDNLLIENDIKLL